MEGTLIQLRGSGKVARWLSLWTLEKFGVYPPVATLKNWLKTDVKGRTSREAVLEPQPRSIRPFKALSLAEQEQV